MIKKDKINKEKAIATATNRLINRTKKRKLPILKIEDVYANRHTKGTCLNWSYTAPTRYPFQQKYLFNFFIDPYK